jgi:transcriptional regulator with XRE-family HTH domain
MKLADYLAQAGLSDADFADLIGVNRSTVSRLRRTGQCPSRQTIAAIAKVTEGKVSADDFWLVAA